MWRWILLYLRLQHTEEKEDSMEVEEGEMGEDDAPAPWYGHAVE